MLSSIIRILSYESKLRMADKYKGERKWAFGLILNYILRTQHHYILEDFLCSAALTLDRKKCCNFRSRRWGSSLPGLRRRDPPLSPHRRERKFSAARVSRVTLKHLPQPIRSYVRSFGTLGQILKFKKTTF
jgi:hypothetical protein